MRRKPGQLHKFIQVKIESRRTLNKYTFNIDKNFYTVICTGKEMNEMMLMIDAVPGRMIENEKEEWLT